MKKVIIFGGKGNGTVLASMIEDINEEEKKWDLLGFINDGKEKRINDYPVLGKISENLHINHLKYNDVYFIWTLFSSKLKDSAYKKLVSLNIPLEKFATIVHHKANVPKKTVLGNGVSIHAFANISAKVKIGNHVQIFANTTVGHNSNVGDCSFISMGSSVGSGVNIEKGSFLGINSSIRENLKIGEWSTVGMGSVVIKNVEKKTIVVGNPAKKL